MCGISGILSRTLHEGQRNQIVRDMMQIQHHRGPDEEGFYSDSQVSLGHNRLSILDLKHGKQPIFNENRTLCVIYNGEIYNHPELKSGLISKGHSFTTSTDTEVIVHAFEEWGEDSFIKYNGMFSFALWNILKKELYLVRDRIGIKPLYFYNFNQTLSFSSEIKAFNCLPDLHLTVDPYSLGRYLSFQNYYGQNTLYKNVQKIEPGTFHKIDPNLKTEIKQYYKVQFFMDYSRSFSDWMEEYSTTFNESVKRHLISDVKVGSYLSGGFDSSLVSWAAQQNLAPDRLLTFNGFFKEGQNYDESHLAQNIATHLNTDHHKIAISHRDFQEEIDKIIYHLDEPMMGPGAFSQYIVAREISKKVKVVLTGHGGDEFFGGYPVYKAALLKEGLFKNRNEVFRGLTIPDFIRLAYFVVFPLFRPMLRFGLHILFTPREIRKLLNPDFIPRDLDQVLENDMRSVVNFELKPFLSTLNNYIYGYLPGLFLVEDKISMAHSLESRTPICDYKLLELSTSIPAKVKLKDGQLKALPKDFGRDKLPPSLYNQPKRGFPTPIHLWFQTHLKNWFEERFIQNCHPIFNKSYLEKFWRQFLNMKHDNLYTYNYGCKLFSIMCTTLILNQVYHQKKIQVE